MLVTMDQSPHINTAILSIMTSLWIKLIGLITFNLLPMGLDYMALNVIAMLQCLLLCHRYAWQFIYACLLPACKLIVSSINLRTVTVLILDLIP